ncbi:Mpp10 protein [Lindgomyces ingoldianus]|uniref:Mpp10 protein n=1 Tax=Lindgomyces ingoldianus TaxID=673940 RepID=A0ACB6QXB4_9PLEO|nr:Mpp10 protein [Lindgomyces ingoldianus]KAF2471658.1 Mpp10 protein [Lindgomyces ingoldianus]
MRYDSQSCLYVWVGGSRKNLDASFAAISAMLLLAIFIIQDSATTDLGIRMNFSKSSWNRKFHLQPQPFDQVFVPVTALRVIIVQISMASLSFSPDASISSHTLSAGSAQPPPMDLQNSSTNLLASLLQSPHTFLQPTSTLKGSFLAATKQYLDPVATGVSQVQLQRQQDLRRKRKRGEGRDSDIHVLHLKKLHLEGFGVGQVFEQSRKILDAATEEIELSLLQVEDSQLAVTKRPDSEGSGEEDDEVDGGLSDSSLGKEGVDWEYDGDEVLEDESALDGEEASEEEQSGDEYLKMAGGEEVTFSDEDEEDDEPVETYRPDPNNLNDGFFSIDDFNKQSEFLEQQDARGEPPVTDDEEVDWDADPLAAAPKSGRKRGDDDFSDEESDEEGPTFGNVDLNAPEGDSEDDEPLEDGDMDGVDNMTNANNVMYADFFAPPARKAGKNKKKRGRPNPHNFPSAADSQDNKPDFEEDDVERTMSAVHRDLFEDDDDAESDGNLTDLDPSDPKLRRSTHERRQAKLAEEIRRLEAANVAKRGWQISGEARAADRPLNSLLEEDLEFERAGKPVPVITAEVSEDIEALIKRRILADEFDEVRRRRPDDLATGPKVRRGQFQLDDTKSGKGLAEIYEEEHLQRTDPNYVDVRDEKLKKEHAEIETLWKNVSRKLDSLSSWHYKPKPAAPTLEVRVDAPAIEMEDARPTAGGEVAGASMLAPQELYRPGDEKNKTEVVTKGGMPIAREEMTREQKLRRRRREKERQSKAALNTTGKESRKEKKTKEKKQLIGDLKKGGVQVIGKKGVITDVEGKQVREKARTGAGSLKLHLRIQFPLEICSFTIESFSHCFHIVTK